MDNKRCILFAPAGRFDDSKLELSVQKLNKLFSSVHYEPMDPDGYFSGSIQQRVKQFESALNNSAVEGIMNWVMAVRGGYGTIDLAKFFEGYQIKKKLIISGFSDLSILLNMHPNDPEFYPVYGLNAIASFATPVSNITKRHIELLINSFEEYNFDNEIFSSIGTISEGETESEIFGGCLSVVVSALGTPFFPDLKGKILFLEDVAEPVYKIDRMLNQLEKGGILDKLSGVVLGDFYECENQYGITPDDIFIKYFEKKDYPVISNFPMGHGKNQVPIKFKCPVKLTTRSKENNMLEYLY